MKKSELKKRILEALTPDEASKVDAKYKEIYAGMVGKNPLKMKKYDNPDKVAYGRAINLIQKESLKLAEKLGKKAKVGDYIEDFTDSDAPQFKGKSDKKKKQMAVAAFLNKEEQKLDEIDAMMEDTQEKSEKNYSNYFKKMDKNRINELVKAALMGPINETLDDKVYGLVDRMLDAMGGSDNLLKELIRAMSTDDAMLYLSAIARDYGMFDDAEEISEKQASTDKYDDNPSLKGKQSELPDGLQKSIIKKAGGKVDETATIKPYQAQIKNNIKANVKSVKTFADEILRHIEAVKTEEPQGDQYVDNPKIKMAIKNLKSVAGEKEGKVDNIDEKEETLSERIFKELREEKSKLTPAEQKIVDDITESLNEGVLDFEKIKQYAKKGLMTAAILLSLNTTGFSIDQQQKISDIVKTEMPASEKGEVDRMHKISVVTTALQQYKRGKKLELLSDMLKQDLEDIKNGPKDVDQVVNIFDFHQDALKDYVPFMFR